MNNEAKSNIKQAVPFLMVKDMEKAIHFYVDGLGFEMTNQWIVDGKIRWCWLQNGGGALMLQEFLENQHNNLLQEKLGFGFSINFICEDALKLFEEFKTRGIQASEPFVGNQMWEVGLSDPDGYKIYFESPTDTPEETTYSEWMNNLSK